VHLRAAHTTDGFSVGQSILMQQLVPSLSGAICRYADGLPAHAQNNDLGVKLALHIDRVTVLAFGHLASPSAAQSSRPRCCTGTAKTLRRIQDAPEVFTVHHSHQKQRSFSNASQLLTPR
jgi:hypothetical protein